MRVDMHRIVGIISLRLKKSSGVVLLLQLIIWLTMQIASSISHSLKGKRNVPEEISLEKLRREQKFQDGLLELVKRQYEDKAEERRLRRVERKQYRDAKAARTQVEAQREEERPDCFPFMAMK